MLLLLFVIADAKHVLWIPILPLRYGTLMPSALCCYLLSDFLHLPLDTADFLHTECQTLHVFNGLNSLLGGNKVNRLEKENAQLHREVEDLNDQIERLHTDMQRLKDCHARELNRTNEQHQQEVGNLKRILDKAYRWFPSFKRFLNMERECLQRGFNEEQTDKLLHGHAINYSGWLHSNEYRRNALADNVSAQVIRDEKRNLFLHINEIPIAQWFKEQFGLGQEKRRGLRR